MSHIKSSEELQVRRRVVNDRRLHALWQGSFGTGTHRNAVPVLFLTTGTPFRSFLQRVSIACYAKRCISHRKFCLPRSSATAEKQLSMYAQLTRCFSAVAELLVHAVKCLICHLDVLQPRNKHSNKPENAPKCALRVPKNENFLRLQTHPQCSFLRAYMLISVLGLHVCVWFRE